MAAEIGNKYNQKLTTPELKKEAYEQYCAHIAKGYTKKSWRFKHPDMSLTWETMEKYITQEPDVFDPIHKQIAECDSLYYWETVLNDSATGKNRKANTASLQIVMRNKFEWDTLNKPKEDVNSEASMAAAQVLNQLKDFQKGLLTHVTVESKPA